MSATSTAAAAAVSKALASQLAEAKAHCTSPAFFQEAAPIFNEWTLHNILTFVAGMCTLFTMTLSFGLAIFHLANYVNPVEQKQFVRIVITPAVFAIFNFFGVWFYDAAPYLEPIADYYEIFALVALFYLCLNYATPEEGQREAFFRELERIDARKKTKLHNQGSLRWFYVIWFLVFQSLVSRFFTTISTWVSTATLCPLNHDIIYAKVIISVIESFSTSLALTGIITFCTRLRPIMRAHQVLAKLVTFKLIVFIQIIQTVIFPALSQAGVFTPAKTVAIDDWTVGIPAFLTCCEMLIFSVAFLHPFRPGPYLPPKGADSNSMESLHAAGSQYQQRHGFWHALLDVLNLWDILSGIWFHYAVVPYFFHKDYNEAGMPAAGGLKVIESESSGSAPEWNQESQTAKNLRMAQDN
ncbi:hypothetical protein EV356DRAFT_508855 [Viridothelium virens]|uniref:DUF300-domain-containing protein n=1 Tax=Viridothelium virens TaxID=1048519 RepID=A0A6A6HJ89_VIRVR|nr:hypothetical protein EV356DRAFT_508855 [Viridothelium virens]